MIKLTPMFSGSRGNCTLVQTPHANILLDVGYGYRAIVARLAKAGLLPQDISAIVITHEHSDHISALRQFAKYSPARVYVPAPSATFVAQTCFCSNVQGVDAPFDIADSHWDIYRCSHDARACFGYRVSTDDDSVASVTDTGIATAELPQFLAPCRTVILESNHDKDMLMYGDYPFVLKRRIASDLGHLSNAQAADVLRQLFGTEVQNVVLAHLSQQNNTAKLAMDCAVNACNEKGVVVGKDIFLYVADQYENEVVL